MAIMSSGFSSVVSGLEASKRALEVTTHNLSNTETMGYSRQRVNQGDSTYNKLGSLGTGDFKLGSGVSIQEIAQIRDMFLDVSYREQASTKKYYETRVNGVNEFEAILGETVLGTSFSGVMQGVWDTLQELSKEPDGIEKRGAFVQSVSVFAEQASSIYGQFNEYQYTLDKKVQSLVEEVNDLTADIAKYNELIAKEEGGGANANDYRDQRNAKLDRLSEIISITYHEDETGMVNVNAEGYQVISGRVRSEMTTQPISSEAPFAEPVWKQSGMKVFTNQQHDVAKGDDKGELKGLLTMRGDRIPDYTYIEDPAKYDTIKDQPLLKTMAQFDYLIGNIARKLNEVVNPSSGAAPYGLDGSQGIDLFRRINPAGGWAISNLKVNEEVTNNVSKLCLSQIEGEDGDNSVVVKMIEAWNEKDLKIRPDAKYNINVKSYYDEIVGDLGSVGLEASKEYKNQSILLNKIDNQRESIKGVSSDDELAQMIRFQQAYNANAKVISVMDEMVEHLINNLIR